jgi:hypothetical protein
MLVVLITTPDSSAQEATRTGFRGWGPRVGLSIDPDQFTFGAHIDFGNFAKRVRFQPNVEMGFGDNLTLFAVNGDVHFRFRENWNVWSPYAGGGLGINFWNWDDDIPGHDNTDAELGVNVVGGIEKGISGGDRFFIEAKLGLVDAPDFRIEVGWTFFH